MNSKYRGYRFPPQIICRAVWYYHRFQLSFRDIEDLLAERGITVWYEAIRLWCAKFGPDYANKLRRRRGKLGDSWFMDEMVMTIRGQRHCLWRAVDQAQRFLAAHSQVHNLFRLGLHLIRAAHYRLFRDQAFAEWRQVSCA